MMFEYVGHVDRALGELQNTADGIGQNFINKTFNSLSSLNSRYSLGSWAGNAALAGFGAATGGEVPLPACLVQSGCGQYFGLECSGRTSSKHGRNGMV